MTEVTGSIEWFSQKRGSPWTLALRKVGAYAHFSWHAVGLIWLPDFARCSTLSEILPQVFANGMTLTLLKNIRPNVTQTTVSMVAATPKPRLVKLLISPEGEDSFSVGGSSHKATRYVIKVEIGGIAGLAAPLVGKQPQDTHVWILGGDAPVFVKLEGPLYQGGPTWRIELTSPVCRLFGFSAAHR